MFNLHRGCTWLVSPYYQACILFFFFFNDTATTEIYTLSLHDPLPISRASCSVHRGSIGSGAPRGRTVPSTSGWRRSEEHTSELQSQSNLVCRLLLEKKKKNIEPLQQVPRTHHHTSSNYDEN